MSWIIGEFRAASSAVATAALGRVHSEPPVAAQNVRLYLRGGGLHETCLSGGGGTGEGHVPRGWALVGLGLDVGEESCRVMGAGDWSRLLATADPDLSRIDGHFALAAWSETEIVLRTDRLGLRSWWIVEQPDRIVFSTRPDWLSQAMGGTHLDLARFGSHWLCYNQLNTQSFLTRIKRIGAGGVAAYSGRGLSVTERGQVFRFESALRRTQGYLPVGGLEMKDLTHSRLEDAIRPVVRPRIPGGARFQSASREVSTRGFCSPSPDRCRGCQPTRSVILRTRTSQSRFESQDVWASRISTFISPYRKPTYCSASWSNTGRKRLHKRPRPSRSRCDTIRNSTPRGRSWSTADSAKSRADSS